MKIQFKTFLFILLFTFSFNLFSQTDGLLKELPKTDEDFVKSEKQAINTINWLDKTPINQDVNYRKKQMMLLLAWLTNSPTVSIEIDHKVLPFTEKNPELLMTFMGGWAKYCLENSYSTDSIKCNLAGIRNVIAFYKNGNGLKKDKKMDKLIEMESKNELENWVIEQLQKNNRA